MPRNFRFKYSSVKIVTPIGNLLIWPADSTGRLSYNKKQDLKLNPSTLTTVCVHSWVFFHSPVWEISVCVRVSMAMSLTRLLWNVCNVHKRGDQLEYLGLCSGLPLAPGCRTVWFVQTEETIKSEENQRTLSEGINNCQIRLYKLLNSLLSVTKLWPRGVCCPWVTGKVGGSLCGGLKTSRAGREREEHMPAVKRVIQQPLWYPPLVWLQLAWTPVKKTKNCFLEQRNPQIN